MNSEMKSKYDRLLMALLGKEALVERWWISKNKAFDMKSPLEMYAEDVNRVDRYLKGQLNDGYF
jgi:hypothetical protein